MVIKRIPKNYVIALQGQLNFILKVFLNFELDFSSQWKLLLVLLDKFLIHFFVIIEIDKSADFAGGICG